MMYHRLDIQLCIYPVPSKCNNFIVEKQFVINQNVVHDLPRQANQHTLPFPDSQKTGKMITLDEFSLNIRLNIRARPKFSVICSDQSQWHYSAVCWKIRIVIDILQDDSTCKPTVFVYFISTFLRQSTFNILYGGIFWYHRAAQTNCFYKDTHNSKQCSCNRVLPQAYFLGVLPGKLIKCGPSCQKHLDQIWRLPFEVSPSASKSTATTIVGSKIQNRLVELIIHSLKKNTDEKNNLVIFTLLFNQYLKNAEENKIGVKVVLRYP